MNSESLGLEWWSKRDWPHPPPRKNFGATRRHREHRDLLLLDELGVSVAYVAGAAITRRMSAAPYGCYPQRLYESCDSSLSSHLPKCGMRNENPSAHPSPLRYDATGAPTAQRNFKFQCRVRAGQAGSHSVGPNPTKAEASSGGTRGEASPMSTVRGNGVAGVFGAWPTASRRHSRLPAYERNAGSGDRRSDQIRVNPSPSE